MAEQLSLHVRLQSDATFTNFYPGSNTALLTALQRLLNAAQAEPFIYIWGQAGVGRSHLLQACCHVMSDNKMAMYLPLSLPELTPAVLADMENCHLVCLDDIDAVLGDSAWEEALFHFYNRIRDGGQRLLVAGDHVPGQSACRLADLCSRLSWGLVFQVQALKDEEKVKALQIRAAERGLQLSDDVGHFLLRHYQRDMNDLFMLLDRLDQASLAAQRKLTIPFIKTIIPRSLKKI